MYRSWTKLSFGGIEGVGAHFSRGLAMLFLVLRGVNAALVCEAVAGWLFERCAQFVGQF